MTSAESKKDVPSERLARPLVAADLPEGELETILSRVEYNLESKRALTDDGARFHDAYVLPALPGPPSGEDLRTAEARLDLLRALGAPFFGPAGAAFRNSGRIWLRPLYGFLNLPLRLFGRRQHGHNNETLIASSALLSASQGIVGYLHALDPFLRGVTSSLRCLMERAVAEQSSARAEATALRREVHALRAAQADLEREILSLRQTLLERPGGEAGSESGPR